MEPAAGMLQVKLEPGLVQFRLLEAIQCEAQLFFIHVTGVSQRVLFCFHESWPTPAPVLCSGGFQY